MPDDKERTKTGLSHEFIQKLLKGRSAQVSEVVVKWPGSANMIILAAAVESHKHVVIFTNGKRFKIRYRPDLYVNDDNPKGCVWISPDNNNEFAPCGYFTHKYMKEAVSQNGANARTS